MKLEAAGVTHVGRVRRANEDALLVRPEHGILAVADGMGGHPAGEVAAALAVRALVDAFPRRPSPRMLPATLLHTLRGAVAAANRAMEIHATLDPATAGMGTTLTALAFLPGGAAAALAHVGDSRAYLLRAGRLAQLTEDHTWVQEQVAAGVLTPAAARRHARAATLTSALGEVDGPERLDARLLEPVTGDVYLLCSDGLSGMLEDHRLAELMRANPAPAAAAAALIEAGNAAGGRDNLTAVVARLA
ncbi:MAG: PP2C family serine/threonine-protein phosphatase [Gemmatimonadota bacterium]